MNNFGQNLTALVSEYSLGLVLAFIAGLAIAYLWFAFRAKRSRPTQPAQTVVEVENLTNHAGLALAIYASAGTVLILALGLSALLVHEVSAILAWIAIIAGFYFVNELEEKMTRISFHKTFVVVPAAATAPNTVQTTTAALTDNDTDRLRNEPTVMTKHSGDLDK